MPKQKRLTRHESQEQTRQRLLDVAIEVFAEKGFERASVDEIAERAGYSKGAVYSNFASKEDLALAILDRRIEQQLGALAVLIPAQGGDPDFWIAQGETGSKGPWDPLLMELLVRAFYNQDLREHLALQQKRVLDSVAAVLSGGNSPTQQQRDAVILTIALGNGLSMQYAVNPDPHLMQLYAQAVVRWFNELATPSKTR